MKAPGEDQCALLSYAGAPLVEIFRSVEGCAAEDAVELELARWQRIKDSLRYAVMGMDRIVIPGVVEVMEEAQASRIDEPAHQSAGRRNRRVFMRMVYEDEAEPSTLRDQLFAYTSRVSDQERDVALQPAFAEMTDRVGRALLAQVDRH